MGYSRRGRPCDLLSRACAGKGSCSTSLCSHMHCLSQCLGSLGSLLAHQGPPRLHHVHFKSRVLGWPSGPLPPGSLALVNNLLTGGLCTLGLGCFSMGTFSYPIPLQLSHAPPSVSSFWGSKLGLQAWYTQFLKPGGSTCLAAAYGNEREPSLQTAAPWEERSR